jgi:hypothetical protein
MQKLTSHRFALNVARPHHSIEQPISALIMTENPCPSQPTLVLNGPRMRCRLWATGKA